MKTFYSLLLFCIVSTTNAQTNNNSILWKISGNGLKESSYLFGTIHAVPEKYFDLNDSIKQYINLSKQLMMELNPDIPLKEQIKLAQRMFLPKGKSIGSYMKPEDYDRLYNYLRDSIHIKESKLNNYTALKPMFFQMMIFKEMIGDVKTFEIEIQKYAGKKKPLLELETVNEQMDILDSIPFDQQLTDDFENINIDKEYYSLLDAYQSQKIQDLDSLMNKDENMKNNVGLLLNNRNAKWLPKIEESIHKSSTFIAVGCGHVIGQHGLINLLKSKGYIVEPVIFTFQNRRKM